MERRVPMMRRCLQVLSALLLIVPAAGWAENIRAVVLVSAGSDVDWSIADAEVRRLFLGRPVVKNELHLTPVINQTDPLLYEVFVKKVVFMSVIAYERHLLSNVVRLGGLRPPVAEDTTALLKLLRTGPEVVTFMWEDTARRTSGVTIIKELWRGNVE